MLQQDFEQQLISNNFTKELTGIDNKTIYYISPKFRRTFNNDRTTFQLKVELYINNVILYIYDVNTLQGNKGQAYNYDTAYESLKALDLIKENGVPLDYIMD